jgi:hypothetical protein
MICLFSGNPLLVESTGNIFFWGFMKQIQRSPRIGNTVNTCKNNGLLLWGMAGFKKNRDPKPLLEPRAMLRIYGD